MAEQPMIEISQNDNLERVIRICNTNFRAIAANSKISTGTISDDVAREMAAMAQAFNEELDSEARIRASADDDLEDMITGLDTHFLPTTGGTITGDLDIEGDAFSNQEQFYFTFKTTDHTQYTPVASPCFVLDTTEMDLYYYDNGSYSHLTNNSSASTVTGVKGDEESTYRTGNVNLTCSDIGAATANHSHNYATGVKGNAETDYRTGNVNLTPDNIGAAKKSEAIKNITRSGTTFTATRTDDTTFTFSQQDNNTTYSAGKGLALSGTTFRTTIPRVAKSCNSIPGLNTVIFEEYTSGSNYNLPSNAWYHIITQEGNDAAYATQLALGMTADAAYYRKYSGSSWGGWKSLINTNTITGVKGNAESSYRTGNVNLTPANIGAAAAHSHPYLSTSGGTISGNLYNTSTAITAGYCQIDGADNNNAGFRLRSAKSAGGSVVNGLVFHKTWSETTYTIQIASDRRLKNHIEYLDKHDSALFIKSLNPVLYSLKSDKNNDKHLGFYAQDVQESDIWDTSIVRESENTKDDKDSPNNIFSLDYTQLHAPIVAALQDALERIEQLEARVAELEAKLNE